MVRSPPGSVTFTLRSLRLSRAAATAAAQAAEPQARVRPEPRSQVRMTMASRETICANITLAHIVSRDAIVIRTWERGSGLTRACGSAACAAAVAAARLKRSDRKVKVTLPGGDLTIDWR